MSLLSRPRHIASVQPYTAEEGRIGQKEYSPTGDAVTVRGNMHPVRAQELERLGLQNFTTTAFHCLEWPGDQHCRVTLTGAEWDQIGEAKLYDMSARTRHYEVILRKR